MRLINYTIQPGETFYSIARKFNLTPEQLRAANPEVVLADDIVAGQIIRIPYASGVRDVINVNGFTCCDIPMQSLLERLPYLSWLSPLSFLARPDGTLISRDDTALIQAAREAGVASMMVISNIDETGMYSGELAHSILMSPMAQLTLISGTITNLVKKGYYGLIMDFEYIFTEDYPAYAQFTQSISGRLRPMGYIVCATIRLSAVTNERANLQAALRFTDYRYFFNNFIVMNNECPPLSNPAKELDQMQDAIEFGISLFPSQMMLLGLPNCCYDWEILSYTEGTPLPLSQQQAGTLSGLSEAGVKTDALTQTPYFEYHEIDGTRHIVCSNSAEGAIASLQLIQDYKLGGSSYWRIDLFPLESFQATGVKFEIRKPLAST